MQLLQQYLAQPIRSLGMILNEWPVVGIFLLNTCRAINEIVNT